MTMKIFGIVLMVWGSYACAQEVHVFPVQGNVSMIVGPGGNTTVQVGKEGIVLVDTQTAAAAPQVMAAIRTLSDRPIIWVINNYGCGSHGRERCLDPAGRIDRCQ